MDDSVLSKGAIQACIDNKGPPKPRFQVLGIKKIQSDNNRAAGDRYRLQLSDGIHYQPGMMATQMNNMIMSGELNKFAVIQVEKLIVNTVQNRKIMIIINLTVLHDGGMVGKVLGSPKNLEITTVCENAPAAVVPQSKGIPQQQQSSSVGVRPPLNQNRQPQSSHSSFGIHHQPGTVAMVKEEQKTPSKQFYGAQAATATRQYEVSPSLSRSPQSQIGVRNVFPIASLNPYQNKWTIKARVTNKPHVRNYSNSRGEGRVMSVDFVDQSGEIRGTAFNEDADRLFPVVQMNKVYLVSRGRLKPANKQFNPCNNDYEITFTNETQIEECMDGAEDLPTISYNFRPISSLNEIPKDSIVDVVGICTACPDLQTITTRTTNKQLSKRDITLTDKSGCSVTCTIWGNEAERFDGSNQPVVALKGVRTSEFNGVTLSCISSTTLSVNPDMQEAHNLRGWYETYGRSQQTTSLSAIGSFDSSQTPYLTYKQVKEVEIGKKEKPDYFNSKGTVIYLKRDNFMYKACAKPECNKKVVEVSPETYLCEKCGYRGPDFKYRMIMKLNLADSTGNLWIDCFNESAETILGISSQELGQLRDMDPSKFEMILDEVNFKEFIFKLRAKVDTYNDEQRLRCSVFNVSPLNYSQECRRRLVEIKELMSK